MQTTYQIHLEGKEHKAQLQIESEKEKRRNKLYACTLCPHQGPWNHKRQLKQHMHTYQHKMAKKVETMVSKIFTDQPIDDNLEELQLEQKQLAEKKSPSSATGVKEPGTKAESEEECLTTSSSSLPSPSAVVIHLNDQPPTAAASVKKVKPEHRSPAELSEFVRKMLEPMKEYRIPLPPSRRTPELSDQTTRGSSAFPVLNDVPNMLLPCNLDLSRPLDQICSPMPTKPPDRQMEIWEEAVFLVQKLSAAIRPSLTSDHSTHNNVSSYSQEHF